MTCIRTLTTVTGSARLGRNVVYILYCGPLKF